MSDNSLDFIDAFNTANSPRESIALALVFLSRIADALEMLAEEKPQEKA